ncbi:MAG: type I glutamate--ammonia ligase [Geminicoccaceae bacterium]
MSDVAATIERIAAEGIRTVDFRFSDLSGRWRHLGYEAGRVDAAMLGDGVFIDGSAVPGWRDITEADLLLRPDLASAFADPFAAQPTLVLICDVAEPATGLGYERDPRSAAQRAETFLRGCRFADEVRVAVDLAFSLFDEVKVEVGPLRGLYSLASAEHGGAGGREGHRPGPDAGYLALPPADQMADIRAEMASVMGTLGTPGMRHVHGLGRAQNWFSGLAGGLVAAADQVQTFKYVVHQVAASYGKVATFMAKPVADARGSGMSIHQSLWRDGRPTFAGQGYADLSQICLQFVAGVMAHARALNAFTNPTTNSYKRLRAGQDEPVLIAYAAHNRSAALRIPYAAHPDEKRVELRFPDPTANPYLALAAVLMAGLDGIEHKLEPGDAMDRNLYDLRPEEAEDLASVSGSLPEALDALEADHDFLARGDVLPADLIESYVEVKRRECDEVQRTPHPVEFQLYLGL